MIRRKPLSAFAVFVRLFPSMLLIYPLTTTASKQSLPRCHEDERLALLEFKQSFVMYRGESCFGSWNPTKGWEGKSCCSWYGVQCDKKNGHVIGLDLGLSVPQCVVSASSINSSSSLFRLTYLEKLVLSYTYFDDSRIPSAIGNFSRLKVLNLSSCGFTGQVPPEILGLTNLSSLDLSENFLKLEKPNMEDLAWSLTKLEELNLGWMDISAPLPVALANLTSLKLLAVPGSYLQGEFPTSILKLPNLEVLDVSLNENLSGALSLPTPASGETAGCASLRVLDVRGSNFSSPTDPEALLGNCTKLSMLRLSGNWFQGKLPSFVNLSQLTVLELAANAFTGEIPSSYGNLTLLSNLDLSSNRLTGQIPSSIGYLNQLSYLYLGNNSLTGSIPPSFGSLSSLYELDLSSNRLTGPIPSSLGNLTVLHELDLSSNRLTDPIPFSLGNPTHLSRLNVRSNQLTGTIPSSIGNLCRLSKLDLSSNRLVGQIPSSLGNLASLIFLNLSRNHLTSHSTDSLMKLKVLETLDLMFNRLHGQPPNPPTSIMHYLISIYRLSGRLPTMICNLNRSYVLDLGNNKLSGTIPQCLSNSSNTLEVLSLHDNNFSGAIPQSYTSLCKLKMMDLGSNRLQGPLPHSLTNCIALEFLDFGNNLIDGTFPSWVGSLSKLRILILQSNRFQGEILEPTTARFTCWKGMRDRNLDNKTHYVGESMRLNGSWSFAEFEQANGSMYSNEYDYSMTIFNKGSETVYAKIHGDLTVIDFSSNNFSGVIPGYLGRLQGLHLLNLSNNYLTGQIPSVLRNLTRLEALDTSRNMLYGDIPYELTSLSFLEVFNVSYNQLSGAIPRGKQFIAFDNSSYIGNVGLCGDPLSKKCGETHKEAPPSENSQRLNTSLELDWKIILMGFASGIIVGVVLGQGINIGQENRFVRKLKQRVRRRHR